MQNLYDPFGTIKTEDPTTPPVTPPVAPPPGANPSNGYDPGIGPNGTIIGGGNKPPISAPTASTPTVPGVSRPVGSITLDPGYKPDWQNLIKNDPSYLAAQAEAKQRAADAAAMRKQMLRQALLMYGGLPPGFGDQYGDIDQSTLDLAGQNEFSVLKNLARNYSQSQEQFKRSLAGRGALQSGDLNYGMDQLEHGYGQQRYDAANQVGGQINNALNSYTDVLNGNMHNLSLALQGAESNVQSNPAYTPRDAKTAKYDSGKSATYGQPIYVDGNGNLFDVNGNPFTPPKSKPAEAPNFWQVSYAPGYDPATSLAELNAGYGASKQTGQPIALPGGGWITYSPS